MASPLPPPIETRLGAAKTKDAVSSGEAAILARSLKVGAGTGAIGLVLGYAAGIVRSSQVPKLLAFATGLQCAPLGGIFYGVRAMALQRHGPGHHVTPMEKIGASTIGGAVAAGVMSGIIRGPRKIPVDMLLVSLLGAGGQFAVNKITAPSDAPVDKTSWFSSKWSPIKKITDQEYASILEEKLLRVEVEIALVDDNIAALKAQKQEQANNAFKQPSPSTASSGQGQSSNGTTQPSTTR